jgi:AcrR family transcriptional regulator
MMASRKGKAFKKKPPMRTETIKNAPPEPLLDAPDDLISGPPSSAMTREIEIANVDALLGDAVRDSARRIPAAPSSRSLDASLATQSAHSPYATPTTRVLDAGAPGAAPTTPALDDLAQTMEAPAAPRILLLDAAEAIIAEIGYAETTSAEIARYSGVSIDVFHAHFANKTAVLHALTERLCAHAHRLLDDALHVATTEQKRPSGVVEAGLRVILDALFARSSVVRGVLAAGDERILRGLRELAEDTTTMILDALSRTTSGITDARREDVSFVVLMTMAIAEHASVVRNVRDPEELKERALTAALSYLGRGG